MGDSLVALWSSVRVGGAAILSQYVSTWRAPEVLEEMRKTLVACAYGVIRLKGYTSWAIGYSMANLVRSLLRDQYRIHPVSLPARGFYGIRDEHEVFLSLAARIGRDGVLGVVHVKLTEETVRQSAENLWELQQQLQLPKTIKGPLEGQILEFESFDRTLNNSKPPI